MQRSIGVTCLAGVLGVWALGAQAESPVRINGYLLSAQEVVALERQLGTRVQPGDYLVNPANGCWANLTTGTSGCPGMRSEGSYVGRGGSGEWNNQGDWSYYSNQGGGYVGGTGDGCIYTENWSNC